jgi:hypothetical protein
MPNPELTGSGGSQTLALPTQIGRTACTIIIGGNPAGPAVQACRPPGSLHQWRRAKAKATDIWPIFIILQNFDILLLKMFEHS